MPHSSALPSSAAPATVSGPVAAGRRPYQHATLDRLADLQSDLDLLIRDVSQGPVSHRQHDANVEAAERIAAGLRAVFRSPSPTRSQNPPLQQHGGKAWW